MAFFVFLIGEGLHFAFYILEYILPNIYKEIKNIVKNKREYIFAFFQMIISAKCVNFYSLI